jgi:GH18 family chitinase
VPEDSLVSEITHVALAFMSPATFNQVEPSSWPLFTTVRTVRSQFPPETAIMIAIGGWGDTDGFAVAAATDGGRKLFAHNVKMMMEATGADGKAADAGWNGWISNPG